MVPNDPRVLSVYGEVSLRLGKIDQGLDALKLALETDPIAQGRTNSDSRTSPVLFGEYLARNKDNCLELVEKLEDISLPIDIVNVFRPSKEAPDIAKQTAKIGAKTLWLQFGIQNSEAEKISNTAGITCIMNKCIKQEYQRLFLKSNPVFPVLKN